MKLSCLLLPGEYRSESSPEEIEIRHICHDLRTVKEGCVFICLRSVRLDFSDLVHRLKEAGAVAVITDERTWAEKELSLPHFRVQSCREAFSRLWSRFCGEPEKKMHLIGITGTNGKTSTATMLYEILCRAELPSALIGTVACFYRGERYSLPPGDEGEERLSTMTTPDPDILFPMLKRMHEAGVEYVVMEVSSHSLALSKVLPLRFDIGIFTNLSSEHLDFHGDMEHYLRAKGLLFRQCELGIFNGDSEYAERLIESAACRVIRCCVAKEGEYGATDIEKQGSLGVSYCYRGPSVRMRVTSRVPGDFSVYNSLLAITAALSLGVSHSVAAAAVASSPPPTGRMERLSLSGYDGKFSVFIDFAHTELALKNLLLTVRAFRREGERIVLLFGCGGDRDKSKRPEMGRVAAELADLVIITSDNSRSEEPKQIISDILSGIEDRKKCRVIKSRKHAIETVIREAKEGDIILLAGKGHETYEITRDGVKHFDEREIVKAALEMKKKGDTAL